MNLRRPFFWVASAALTVFLIVLLGLTKIRTGIKPANREAPVMQED